MMNKNAEYQHKWYLKNRALQIARNEQNKKNKKIFINEYKASRGCSICKENHVACLQFHHLDPTNKKANIHELIKKNLSIENILEEVNKCIILCANCHFKLHYHERQLQK